MKITRCAVLLCLAATVTLVGVPNRVGAEVTGVTVSTRTVVRDGQAFGSAGSYETLAGRIDFALSPSDAHNVRIADLDRAPRDADGRVHFSSDLYVLRPTDPRKANGVLLFEIANRGRLGLFGRFNRGPAYGDPASADFGDGLLMREGYTLVWVGWEMDVPAPALRVNAPPAQLPAAPAADPISVDLLVNARATEAFLVDEPVGRPPVIYPPASPQDAADTLTVRDRFWESATTIPRERWRFVAGPAGSPKVQLDGGFDPGRYYRVTYRATGSLVAGVGLAAIRDAASAFRYRSDLPITGTSAYVFGASQSGRFLRQFLYDGFNADERDRRVFDAVWSHIAGAARGSYNERFAVPSHGSPFTPTQFPFADADQTDQDGRRDGLLARYQPAQRPKIFYTNTSVEYWGLGRAAALTHTSLDGTQDLTLPDNVRIYLLAGTQHAEAAFPPQRTNGVQLNNPTAQANVMRALLRALHDWASTGTPPPASQYPRLRDKTLVPIRDVAFPALSGVSDPRGITGPARRITGQLLPLPFLVPQVDADGNETSGIRVPDVAVPLATTTGWNFRAASIGNPGEIYQLLGSYLPFPRTRAERELAHDPRPAIEERYPNRDAYLQRVRTAALDLIRGRYLLQGDLDDVLARANRLWDSATGAGPSTSGVQN